MFFSRLNSRLKNLGDLPIIFSGYSGALKSQHPKEWLKHLIRDIKYFALGVPHVQDAKMEIKYGVWEGASVCRDEDGRFLGENTALENHPSIEWKEKHFSDNRGLLKVNSLALRQVLTNWKQVISDIVYLRDAYTRKFSIDSPLTFADLYYLSRTATSIPSFLIRRKENPVADFCVPVRFAAMFKVLTGVHDIIVQMIMHRELEKKELYRAPSSLEIFEFGDRRGRFISPTGQGCAGSRAMILEMLEVLIHGKPATKPDGFSELIDDLDRTIQYGIGCGRIELLLPWNDLIRRFLAIKEREPWRLVNEASKHQLHHMGEPSTVELEKVSECLESLVQHAETRGMKSQFGALGYRDFNIEGDSDGCDLYLKRRDEVVKVLGQSMNEINEHLGCKTSTAVYPDDIDRRKFGWLTEQILPTSRSKRSEDLIKNLAANAEPVSPLPSPATRMLQWLSISVVYAVLVVALVGLRPDITAKLTEIRFLAEVTSAFLVSMLAATAAFSAECPGRPAWERFAPLPFIALWLASLGGGCWQDWLQNGPAGLTIAPDLHCFPTIVLLGIVPGILMLAMVRRGPPIVPMTIMALATLAVGSLSAATLRFFHTQDASIMVLTWQFGSVVLLALLGGLVGRRAVPWEKLR